MVIPILPNKIISINFNVSIYKPIVSIELYNRISFIILSALKVNFFNRIPVFH